jgi:16S rRNA A1518/A1519 N6-dimethyltransferase RsmA/KsgA/DIM1 with predicted DNA glycosylase/AP lyase activity
VESTVVLLTRRNMAEDPAAFLKFASLCFRHKRKTLRNNLMPLYDLSEMAEGRLRAEQLSVAELAGLYAKLRA